MEFTGAMTLVLLTGLGVCAFTLWITRSHKEV